jgi:hypothetical protein
MFTRHLKYRLSLNLKRILVTTLATQKNNFYSSLTLQHLSADQGGIANINEYSITIGKLKTI